MTKPADDLEAVRAVAAALEGFDAKEQERIIRWAREKLGLSVTPPPSPDMSKGQHLRLEHTDAAAGTHSATDLKTFVQGKNPRNDVQFAATVAYFHRFVAPADTRKTEINKDDLQEGCRLAGRARLKNPYQTLFNAHNLGLLDKGESGLFAINSVGENLVAMTLPRKAGMGTPEKGGKKKAKKKAGKKAVDKRKRIERR